MGTALLLACPLQAPCAVRTPSSVLIPGPMSSHPPTSPLLSPWQLPVPKPTMMGRTLCWATVLTCDCWVAVLAGGCWVTVLAGACWVTVLADACWVTVLAGACWVTVLAGACWVAVLVGACWVAVLVATTGAQRRGVDAWGHWVRLVPKAGAVGSGAACAAPQKLLPPDRCPVQTGLV
eukprot:1143502-Pelagomonas_calceolata.AAC.8